MSDNRRGDQPYEDTDRSVPTDRKSPVGAPVIRGDESVAGNRAEKAVQFDPDDPDSLAEAAETVRQFAAGNTTGDHLYMLRGAAACAALVRGEGSYKAAAERARDGLEEIQQPDEDEPEAATVSFIRKWARVHDLPRSVRRQVALGQIAPTAAKHIARVSGESRLLLAWATLDGDLTVRQVRSVASTINDGTPINQALAEYDVQLGTLELTLPPVIYRDLRQQASLEGRRAGEIVADALEEQLD
ncbi:hypothetical protein HALLA_18515 [Halostagnicola larsenii XH-48]|uniref:DUF7119 domain-containing protein n=1 Tax=Halostagnicola larsenii XH-48 TaxID=797299 RepID=W0JPH5_9EURY|nr:hypothetical protein [Halostagnicola larsenii]AHG00494.1 hypothetical protein HALLA_18515 [Halostagnicola larsenii XH-48]